MSHAGSSQQSEPPERARQLVDPSGPRILPRPAAVRPSSSLPADSTTFVGRRQTVDAIKAKLTSEPARLLTLTDPGGIGKTRVAARVANELVNSFADGVFFVPLASVTDPGLVAATIGQVLGVRETIRHSAAPVLTEYLRTKQLLLVLDNFEHVVAAAITIAELLDACPRLFALVTSRASLHLSREQIFEVPPMPAPDCELAEPIGAITGHDAVDLFVDRARAARSDFSLTVENARSIVEICHRVDGLPLAIELAAARIRHLHPDAILARLSSRMGLLTGGPRDAPARHQTMRDAIEWSYNLLTDSERRLLERLSVFAGGFTLEAAESIANQESDLGISSLDGVASLVDQSLIQIQITQPDREPAEPRFTPLETIREYAVERLVARGEELVARNRHSAYFLMLTESARPHLRASRQVEWVARLDPDRDNIRAALRWCLDQHQPEHAMRFVVALSRYWQMRGHIAEGRAYVTEVLNLAQASGFLSTNSISALALSVAGTLAWLQGDATAAQSLFERSLAIGRRIENRRGVAGCLNGLANIARDQANYRRARSLYEESLAICRELDDRWAIAVVLNNLGETAQYARDVATAQSMYTEGLAIARELGDRWHIANSVQGLADVAQQQGDHARARQLYEQSLELNTEIGYRSGIAARLEGFAGLAAANNQPVRALRLASAAARLRALTGSPRRPPEDELVRLWLEPAERALSEAAAEVACAEGQAMSDEQAVTYALERTNETASQRIGGQRRNVLTRREREVAALIACGRTNREIAGTLVITLSTAERHVANILSKLELRSRTEVAVWSVEQGLDVRSNVSRT